MSRYTSKQQKEGIVQARKRRFVLGGIGVAAFGREFQHRGPLSARHGTLCTSRLIFVRLRFQLVRSSVRTLGYYP